MMQRDKSGIFIMAAIIVIAIALLAVCILYYSSRDRSPDVKSPSEEELRQAYARAIEDAKRIGENEIYHNLTPILESNKNLIWLNDSDGERVLVVTWTAWDGYVNQTAANVTREVWVTAAPQLKDFIAESNLSGEGCVLRLEQLLGLPPHNGKKWFIEVWARPGDLYRPTPDNEINDTEAELDFPENTSPEYKQWFNNLKDTSYGPNGFPWTRLGYTYDWGNPKTTVGLSEFVIKNGAVIKINAINKNEGYCNA